MFVQLEDAAVVKSQSFPDRVTALHRRVERADPCLVAMHQLSVDVYEQVAVSLLEFLKHLNYLTQRPLRTQKLFISMTLCPLCSLREIFNAAGIYKAADSIHGSSGRAHAIEPELRSVLDDTVETRSFLPPHRTNALPKCHRCHASLTARRASTC